MKFNYKKGIEKKDILSAINSLILFARDNDLDDLENILLELEEFINKE